MSLQQKCLTVFGIYYSFQIKIALCFGCVGKTGKCMFSISSKSYYLKTDLHQNDELSPPTQSTGKIESSLEV